MPELTPSSAWRRKHERPHIASRCPALSQLEAVRVGSAAPVAPCQRAAVSSRPGAADAAAGVPGASVWSAAMSYHRSTPQGQAEDALCDLNMAAAIQTLCESSLFRTAAGRRFEARVVRICREHGQLQLRAYDRARGRSQ